MPGLQDLLPFLVRLIGFSRFALHLCGPGTGRPDYRHGAKGDSGVADFSARRRLPGGKLGVSTQKVTSLSTRRPAGIALAGRFCV